MAWVRMLVFFGVFCLIGLGVHLYLHHRLVRGPEWPAPWGTVLGWILVVLGTSVPASFLVSALAPRWVAQPFAWVAFLWMGFTFFLLVLLVPAELVRIGDWLVARSGEVTSPERRQFLSRSIAGVIGVMTLGLGGVSIAGALREVAIKRVRVPVRALPRGLAGLRVVQLTDIHVGPTIGNGFIQELVSRTNALAPDVIAITGDLVDGSVAELAEHVAPLARLRARHGVYFVTGNHEYYSGADEWVAHLRTLGITVLENARVTLEHAGERLAIAGVHDWTSGQFGSGHDLAKALRDKEPEVPVLLLAHQPKHIDDAAAHGVMLQLSGHTHGGQIFPFNYLVRLQQPYVAGLHDHRGTKLYVSSGTGYWGPPMRLAIPAEITELVLAPA